MSTPKDTRSPPDQTHETPKAKRLCVEKAEKEEKKEEEDFEINVEQLVQSWTPARFGRTHKKPRGREEGNLRGGDFVFSIDGRATTLSFFFEKDSHVYGVTAGHLAHPGERVFHFAGVAAGGSLDTAPLGSVVSNDFETDSLIFKVNTDKESMVDLLKLVPKAGLGERQLRLPAPCASPTAPEQATDVVVYGAMTRGANGTVQIRSNQRRGDFSLIGDIGIQSKDSFDSGGLALTKDGDCGALYLDRKGDPVAIHHVLRGNHPPFTSFGVPLAKVMSKHPFLGGTAGSSAELQQSSYPAQFRESLNIAQFQTNIIGEENYVPESLQIATFEVNQHNP